MATGAVVARILTQYSDKGSKAASKDIAKLGKDFDHFTSKVTKSFALASAAATAFALKIGKDAVKAAMEDQKSAALLANSLKNTTGATEAQIKAVEDYILKQELALGVQDDELRPSLSALATATHSVAEAQRLQSVALDISANRHRDLTEVSIALAKAYVGNFKTLKAMGIPLSETLIKSKNFTGIIKELSAAVGGAAKVAADTFAGRLDRVKLALREAEESLGNVLLPVLQEFLGTVTQKIIPAINKWIETNKDKLIAGLTTAAGAVKELVLKALSFTTWISQHMGLIKTLASILAGMWAGAKVLAFVGAIEKVIGAMRILRDVAIGAATAEAFATGGASIVATMAAIAAAGIVGVGVFGRLTSTTKKATGEIGNLEQKIKDLEQANARAGGNALKPQIDALKKQLADLKKTSTTQSKADVNAAVAKAKADAAATAQRLKDIAAEKAAQAAADAKAKADAAKKLLTEKELAKLKKLGVVPTTETDPIQLEAARLNLLKQQDQVAASQANAILAAKLHQLELNDAAQRYSDILAALSDNKLSTEEVQILAQKWGMTTDQVYKTVNAIVGVNLDPAKWAQPGDALSKSLDGAIERMKTLLGLRDQWTMPSTLTEPKTSDQGTGDKGTSDQGGTPSPFIFNGGGGVMNPSQSTSMFGAETPQSTGGSFWFSGGSGNASGNFGQSININVVGDVISEGDLINKVRLGLQGLVYSGKATTFSSVAL